jgi:integrase
MPAYKDSRTGHWYFKKQIRLPDGTSTRIRGVPKDYDQPDTKAGALEAERMAITRLRSTGTTEPPPPPPPPVRVPTVAEYWTVWLAEAESANASSTVDSKKSAFKNHVLPTLGHLRLDEITFTHVNEWRQGLLKPLIDPTTGQQIRDKLDPYTVAHHLATLHAFLNFAVANDVIPRLPKKWPKQHVPEKERPFLSFEDAERLVAAPQPYSPKPWTSWRWRVMHAMLIVDLRTGLRIGELRALRWRNVHLDRGVLWVRETIGKKGERKEPKGKKHRELPLSNDALRALRSIKQDRWEGVFTLDGGVMSTDQADESLKLMCRSARMMPISWHILRHTFASHLVMRGVALVTVQRLMGHVNIRDTLRYSHLTPAIKQEAVMLLDEPAPGAGLPSDRPRRKPKPPRRPVDAPTSPVRAVSLGAEAVGGDART